MSGPVRTFLERHFLHFNSRELVASARAYEAHLDAGGEMFVSLAGAMSTARIGRILSRMIREGKVHGISCTGANLEEDIFNLLAARDYEHVDWRGLSAADEAELLRRGMNRVTDVCIPETVMRLVEDRLLQKWKRGAEEGRRALPATYLFEVLDDADLDYHVPATDSWVLAAKEMGIPIFTPGWEDSTLGNVLTGAVMAGKVPGYDCVMPGTQQMQRLCEWYLEHSRGSGPAPGFFQIGGGIAGDFAICAVPLLIQDLERTDVPLWGYFSQISDAVTSYGGYSGAPPNEKITWGKLAVDTPRFMIQSDATIVAPLIFAYLLDD